MNTLAESYIHLTSISAGSAAERAASNKITKYSGLSDTVMFIPVALESLGPFSQAALGFISELGRRICLTSGDSRESSFLFQRLSVAVQRCNSAAFRESFVEFSDI